MPITAHLVVSLKVVVEYVDTDGEITSVVRVGPVPALGTKLPPLHHHSMEVDQREQDALELILTRTHLKCVLYMPLRRELMIVLYHIRYCNNNL